jgi:hypothetical protein
MGKEDEVKLIAYRLWEEEGCVDGHDCEHWFRAEVIWGRNQKQSVKESTETELKQVVKQNTKVTGKNKKSKKT